MMVVDRTGLKLIDWDQMGSLITSGVAYFFKFFIIVGGAIPYVFQYIEIHHRKNASGFSLFVCLALCVANILRIEFWLAKPFDATLLIQSIVMMFAMVIMLEIVVRMNRRHTPKAHRKSLLRGQIFPGFWAWHDLWSFLLALGIFALVTSIITACLMGYPLYVEILGLVSVLTEASLGMPQLIRNFQRKSTQGMSVPMVLAWLCGDVAKTAYFVVTAAPLQFWICGVIQITIDILILLQVFFYRNNVPSDMAYNTSVLD